MAHSVVTRSGKGGTYFGATGCGKTYTMAFLARQLALRCTDIPEIGSPTIILIVDRDELQKQGSKLFTKSKEFLNLGEVSVVKNRTQLRQELGARQSGGFYICTIQKFCDREDDKIGLINDRQNIICFSDEAHRTQLEHSKKIQFSKDADENMKAMVSKPYAKVLKEAFPHATFVGFTGTPIAETYQTFGDEIDRYTMDQAVADGLTVSIKYHPRIAKVLLDNKKVKEIENYYKKCAGVRLDYIDIIEKSIYNIDSKICGIIDDYRVLQEPQKVADYVIQFLRTYLEHIAARIYAYENPNEQVPIRGKDKWYTQYMKQLKESNEYGYIWRMHHSLQISTSHYVPAEDGAIRLMDGYLPQLYHLRDQILLADNEEYEIYIQQIELSKKIELKNTFDKIREIIIKEKPGSNILRYITAYLKNDVIRDQLADRTNNLLSYLYLKNEAIPFDEMPYASSLCGHNLSKLRLHKCLEIYDCECQYVSSMVNKEAYDSNILYVIVDHDKLDYYQYEVDIFNNNLYNSKKQQLRKIDTFANHLYVKNYYETTKTVIEKLQKYTLEGIDVYSDMIGKQADFMQEIDDDNKRKILVVLA